MSETAQRRALTNEAGVAITQAQWPRYEELYDRVRAAAARGDIDPEEAGEMVRLMVARSAERQRELRRRLLALRDAGIDLRAVTYDPDSARRARDEGDVPGQTRFA